MNVTNINELEGLGQIDPGWKTTQIGISLFLIMVFTFFLALAYLAEAKPNTGLTGTGLAYCTGILSLASLVFSYSIFYRINSLS